MYMYIYIYIYSQISLSLYIYIYIDTDKANVTKVGSVSWSQPSYRVTKSHPATYIQTKQMSCLCPGHSLATESPGVTQQPNNNKIMK